MKKMSHGIFPVVQGYLTAKDRFWEMDAFRRLAEGRLSELLGRAGVSQDIAMRTVFTTRDGRRLEQALWDYVRAVDPDLAGLEQAYTDGVNAWLADLRAGLNGATLPPVLAEPGLRRERLAPIGKRKAELRLRWSHEDSRAGPVW